MLEALTLASMNLDRYVTLSYSQTMVMKNKTTNKPKLPTGVQQLEEAEKRLMTYLNPMLIKSSLSRHHSYGIVLISNYNMQVGCCGCDCHPREASFIL
jgi:hypothetical protein